MLYIAPYDITPDADRGKVHTLLSSFGNRVQYSVFECWPGEREFARIKAELAPYVTAEFDPVRLYGLCGACVRQVEVIGWGDPPKEVDTWVA